MINTERIRANNESLQECISIAENLPDVSCEEERGLPIEVASLDDSLLVSANDGKVYKCDDRLYQVNKITSLKGLTIKFNEHITPCPVIGENDVFECSGLPMGYGEYDIVVNKIGGRLYTDPSTVAYIAFTTYSAGFGSYKDIFYASDSAGWAVFDENGNMLPIANAMYFIGAHSNILTQFDCPALNENAEFIEWVFANAKVYQKIECVNDIKSFKPYYSEESISEFGSMGFIVPQNATEVLYANEWNIEGQYTASFEINGEIITKTFSRLASENSIDKVTFSNNNGDTLVLNGDEDIIIKYNDIVLEDTPTFTRFNGMFNHSYMFLSYVLCCSEFVATEYGADWYFAECGDSGSDSALPIEIATEAEMTALLTSGEVGSVYKYTGETGIYENGALYVLEVSE